MLAFSAGAFAEISYHGGSEKARERISSLIESRWPKTQRDDIHLAITFGADGLRDYCDADGTKPALALYIYESQFDAINPGCAASVAGVFVDASPSTMGRLAKAIFPGNQTAMLRGDDVPLTPDETQAIDTFLAIPEEGVARGLARLIGRARWDVFLLPVDAAVYQSTDYRLSLETLFRNRKPAVVSVRSLLSKGAVAAAYYTPDQIDESVIRAITRFQETGELVGERPDSVSVGINKAVLRNVYGRVLSAADISAIEAEVNGG